MKFGQASGDYARDFQVPADDLVITVLDGSALVPRLIVARDRSCFTPLAPSFGLERGAVLMLITAVDTLANELPVRDDSIAYGADPAFARP
jgi:hypothetical protein